MSRRRRPCCWLGKASLKHQQAWKDRSGLLLEPLVQAVNELRDLNLA